MCSHLAPLSTPLSLFQAFGIELEYMIVDEKTLDILPISDKLLQAIAGKLCSEFEKMGISWTNELVMHLIEFKTTQPEPKIGPLEELFFLDIKKANELLKPFHAKLLPTAMHPWMDPYKEMHLWSYEQNEIYETFNKIFDCRGHGWANLQSCHINLPFANELEFGRLHASIRLLLPLIPALAASSPFADEKDTGYADYRLFVYQNNAKTIPSIAGSIIPEICHTYQEYQENILQKIYADIAPYDPEKILQFEWCNSRGAITRFDRQSIEIRLVDIQECPKSDLAISFAIISAVRALVENKWGKNSCYDNFSEKHLKTFLDQTIKDGENALIADKEYLAIFGYPESKCFAKELWSHIIRETVEPETHKEIYSTLQFLLKEGTLATRMRSTLPKNFSKKNLYTLYQKLSESLQENRLFL